MKFDLSMEDFTIIQNAIHYYKHVEKRGNFQAYDVARCEALRDKLAKQMVHGINDADSDNESGGPDEGPWLGPW